MRAEVRMARYIEGLERYRAGRLSCEEAAELLGVRLSAMPVGAFGFGAMMAPPDRE